MTASDWKFAKIPASALADKRISGNQLRTLGKLFEAAWDRSLSHREIELDPGELANSFGLPRSTFYDHLGALRSAGWLQHQTSSKGIRIELTIRESEYPDSTTTDSLSSKRDPSYLSSSSSRSENPKFRTLKEAGIGEPLRSELAQAKEIPIDWIRKHIRFAELRGDPRRLLAYRLKMRDPEPSARELADLDPFGEEARARYSQGSMAEYLEEEIDE